MPRLLRSWFGDDAGRPGTSHLVEFTQQSDGWHVAPVREGE